jgi:hypothetical protein
MRLERLPKRDLIALVRRYEDGLARGRRKGADVLRLARALRESIINRAVADLLRNPETARWRDDAIVDYLFTRQHEIGINDPYAPTTFDRRVRKAIKKLNADSSQPRT